jgi:hypothetical protein
MHPADLRIVAYWALGMWAVIVAYRIVEYVLERLGT